ncbi:uncharacterized protein LOC113236096, partial [Hyposmocoma kahamanoa]|uniref:uncharacterized protein LOC113236096 n=1 Tax=Hyposmocoma kahamanoa TaxID=1477025 RepID=UPI000E6D916E
FIIESHELDLAQAIPRALKVAEEMRPDVRAGDALLVLDRENQDDAQRKLCQLVSQGVSMIIDLSWSPWEVAEQLASNTGVPILHTSLSSQQLIKALDDYLETRNATDAAYILESESDVDRTLYTLLGHSNVRVWVHAGLTRDSARALKSMRPEPSFYVIVGETGFVMDTYRRAVKEKLVRRDYRWNLVFTDYPSTVDTSDMIIPTMILYIDQSECCKLTGQREECSCPSDMQRKQLVLNSLLSYITDSYFKLERELDPVVVQLDCEAPAVELNGTRARIWRLFAEDVEINNDTTFYWDQDRSALLLRSRFILSTYKPEENLQTVASWSADDEYKLLPGVELEPLKFFFRIGTTPAVPWTMPRLDPETGEPQYNKDGQPIYDGYCIELIGKLAETMEFDYEIVTPKSGSFGRRLTNGSWDGVVGDLMRGETDLAVAALTMTAEREEVIDFVAPYFEQTGILIVIRKPIRKTSLFKFMTVLRTEVWLSIVGALVLTGFMIWLLDKYSPYSARNNPDAYPYPCREFTLKESFWFALTSFTPQGGGEAPKALSGRTLVAAYWLFVVLMLATFTANLAAFLTVERMQTPVSSLEQLARQSRINYTVVESSTIHQYFINMKFAEDTLY